MVGDASDVVREEHLHAWRSQIAVASRRRSWLAEWVEGWVCRGAGGLSVSAQREASLERGMEPSLLHLPAIHGLDLAMIMRPG